MLIPAPVIQRCAAKVAKLLLSHGITLTPEHDSIALDRLPEALRPQVVTLYRDAVGDDIEISALGRRDYDTTDEWFAAVMWEAANEALWELVDVELEQLQRPELDECAAAKALRERAA